MSTDELHPFPEPHTLEEAQQLVIRARRLLAQAQDVHDQALGAAIRVALRGGRRISDVPGLLELTYAQTRRYLGRDDLKLLPHDPDAAADMFLRYLPEIDRGDISWNHADELYIQPTPAVERVAALAARDGRTFPWSVRDVAEGLMRRGVVRGDGTRSSVSRTRNGQTLKVWAMELVVLTDLDLVWSPDFTDPLARSFRAIDHKFDTADQKAAAQRRQPDPRAAQEFLRIVRSSDAAQFGEIRGDRIFMHPQTAVARAIEIAAEEGQEFPYTASEIADGLHQMGALRVDGSNKRSVGRRIEGKLVRVWDIDITNVR